ncbi:hypothetical protein [Saccharopolyspora hattusasensis]|uniref:hypothetical protein n=1 Tax=Saccharopolyspora hattusasensis TaxID=1128679 RepID=UPI003D953B78
MVQASCEEFAAEDRDGPAAEADAVPAQGHLDDAAAPDVLICHTLAWPSGSARGSR